MGSPSSDVEEVVSPETVAGMDEIKVRSAKLSFTGCAAAIPINDAATRMLRNNRGRPKDCCMAEDLFLTSVASVRLEFLKPSLLALLFDVVCFGFVTRRNRSRGVWVRLVRLEEGDRASPFLGGSPSFLASFVEGQPEEGDQFDFDVGFGGFERFGFQGDG